MIELAFVLGKNNAGDVSAQLNGIAQLNGMILRAVFSPQRKLVSLEAKKTELWIVVTRPSSHSRC